MCESTHRKNVFVSLVFLLGALLIFLLMAMPADLQTVYEHNWVCDSICLYLSLMVLVILYAKGKFDITSSLPFASGIYIIMFFVTPLYDISVGDTSVFGVTDLFDYGVKGSIVALAGFISFCICYVMKYHPIDSSTRDATSWTISESLKEKIVQILILFWVVDFVVAIYIVAITQGFSISYILSFGLIGDSSAFETTSTTLGFIGQFTRSIVTVYLLYFSISDSTAWKIVLFAFTALVEIINGFRYMIVILVVGLFFFIHISNKKRINLFKVLILLALMSIIIGIVGYSRNSVRGGNGFSIDGFGISSITDAILGNFRIYKSYYSVIKAVPNMTPYIYFDQIVVYTIIMAIPRTIWPSKPLNPGTKAQLYGMNAAAVASGFAYPCLGEYYYGFGELGVVVFMGILGRWLASLSNQYRKNAKSAFDIVLYCVTIPLTLQLLIRGYTPSNFYLVLALFIPYWLVNSILRKQMTLLER